MNNILTDAQFGLTSHGARFVSVPIMVDMDDIVRQRQELLERNVALDDMKIIIRCRSLTIFGIPVEWEILNG